MSNDFLYFLVIKFFSQNDNHYYYINKFIILIFICYLDLNKAKNKI